MKNKIYPSSTFSKIVSAFLWLFFLGNIGLIFYYYPHFPNWHWKELFRINGFTVIIWATVTFFSAVVTTFAGKYLVGFTYQKRFIWLSLGFTFSVILLVFSEHVLLLLLSWFLMGVFMAQLIGVNRKWGEAKEASKYCQTYFLIGTIFLSAGLLLLSFETNQFTLSGLTGALDNVPYYILLISAICIIFAAIIQSAMYPFHRWLLSAMTAPTPASALMHAGFVNGAGVLLTLLATLLIQSNTMTLLFIIGGLTAIIAQFTKLLQVNVKQKLACSTIAQMGFMIMQCGLGFFNAAVVHLILHGFYKAYLFLSSGEEIAHVAPKKPEHLKIKPGQALVVLLFGLSGAVLFAWLTGKGLHFNSGIFLTLIVAITVGQAAYNIVKHKHLSIMQKTFIPAVFFMIGIGLYALLYNGVTVFMSDMPNFEQPQPLSAIQVVFGLIFLIGFFIMKLGIYKKVPWLYVKLMNASQPYKKTVFYYKNSSK